MVIRLPDLRQDRQAGDVLGFGGALHGGIEAVAEERERRRPPPGSWRAQDQHDHLLRFLRRGRNLGRLGDREVDEARLVEARS